MVLQRLADLCAEAPEAVQLRDWKALKNLPSRSMADVQQLFYPNAPADVLADPEDASRHRAKGFLAALTPPNTILPTDSSSSIPNIRSLTLRPP